MYSVYEDNSIEAMRACLTLSEAHYNEVEDKATLVPYNINWPVLEALQAAGALCLVVAKDGDQLIGYFANIINQDIMTSRLVASELAIYVDPSRRGGKLFFKMLKTVEESLIKRGVTTQLVTFKAGHNTELPLKCGFTHTETTYQKILVT